jgi:hypothetical protein
VKPVASVVDPHRFNADPDPGTDLGPEPDPDPEVL